MTDKLDPLDHMKKLVEANVKKLDPGTTIARAVTISVSRFGKNPGPDHVADAKLEELIGSLARAAYQETELRYLLGKLPDEYRRAYNWNDLN